MKPSLLFALTLLTMTAVGQSAMEIFSPSKKISVKVTVGDSIRYSVWYGAENIIGQSAIALVTDRKSLGVRSNLKEKKLRSVKETIENAIPFKRRFIPDEYSELTLKFREGFTVKFRAYDDGAAYRFEINGKDSLIIKNEIASFNLAGSSVLYWPEVSKRDDADEFHTSFEEPYKIVLLTDLSKTSLGFTPVLADLKHTKVFITESDLLNYPGMFLRKKNSQTIVGVFAPYPKKEEVKGGGFRQWIVTERNDFIAKVSGTQSLPWRVIGIAREDKELLMNDLVFRLASPPSTSDWSWVSPGISTEEWICGINLYGVDFKAGLNTETYKYYIDFAKDTGLDYVMLDAGWSDSDDLFKITPGMDMDEIARYAKSKNIKPILWTLAMTLDRQLDEALVMFNKWGVKALMTDFMDRDDQKMMGFYKRISEATAKHQLMIMFHGAFKGSGFERTYPNALTREGVLGSEYNVWSEKANPEHDLLIPFIRMASGPMDYEPGFMKNANKQTFKPLPDMVMSQGTRTHQLAMFVVYESPMQMFSGNPSDAWKEKDFMRYLSSIPTTWDETIILDAKLGDYVLLARRKNNDWYVAALTDWTARELDVDLSFLADKSYLMTSVQDGFNAAKNAADYQMKSKAVKKGDTMKVTLAPGGGFVAKLTVVE